MKNMRAQMDDEEFHRFKIIKEQLSQGRNDGALVELMDLYETAQEADTLEEVKDELP